MSQESNPLADLLDRIERARRGDDAAFHAVIARAFELEVVTTSDVMHQFGMNQTSVARWRVGRTAPHPAMRDHVYTQLSQWVRAKIGGAATLAWFVAEAMDFAGLRRGSWQKTPHDEQVRILRAWQGHVGAKVDFVRLANFDRIHVPPYVLPKLGGGRGRARL
jgi:hypothetical protein